MKVLISIDGKGVSINGVLTVSFSIEDIEGLTGEYYHECRIVDSSGQARVVTFGTVAVRN